MRTYRRRFRISLILLVLPLIFALSARANGDGDRKETKYRWDIIKILNTNPPTVVEGGFASALASDGSSITVTGHGTFEPREPDEVTGGGAWTTYAPDGKTVTGAGTYRVKELVRFDLAPGILIGPIDNIPGAKGDLSDTRAGLMFVRIAYSDGSKGILVFSCGLDGSPASIFEGVTASKGYTDYWNTLPSLTLFHILSEDEKRDRD